jgi:hypothetical protein
VDRANQSFAESEGISEFPALLEWGKIDKRLRSRLWGVFHAYFERRHYGIEYYSPVHNGLRNFLIWFFVTREYWMRDDIVKIVDYHKDTEKFMRSYFDNGDYVKIFTLIEDIIVFPSLGQDLRNTFENALNVSYSPYRIFGDPPKIVPILSDEQAKMLKTDLGHLKSSPFQSAKDHTKKAISALDRGDHADCIRESITSVEAAIREFTGDPNAILSSALSKLTKQGQSHPALNQAFEKLYAYTSDAKGIRHSQVFGEGANVDTEEAIFFLSTCVSFVGFLARKKAKSSLS